eukprot:4824196-Pleurochrysis_carterae.AAC.1
MVGAEADCSSKVAAAVAATVAPNEWLQSGQSSSGSDGVRRGVWQRSWAAWAEGRRARPSR